jgi:hypothetical protein
MLALHVPLHGPLPCEDAMRLWSEILQVEDTFFRKIFNHYRPPAGGSDRQSDSVTTLGACGLRWLRLRNINAVFEQFADPKRTHLSPA